MLLTHRSSILLMSLSAILAWLPSCARVSQQDDRGKLAALGLGDSQKGTQVSFTLGTAATMGLADFSLDKWSAIVKCDAYESKVITVSPFTIPFAANCTFQVKSFQLDGLTFVPKLDEGFKGGYKVGDRAVFVPTVSTSPQRLAALSIEAQIPASFAEGAALSVVVRVTERLIGNRITLGKDPNGAANSSGTFEISGVSAPKLVLRSLTFVPLLDNAYRLNAVWECNSPVEAYGASFLCEKDQVELPRHVVLKVPTGGLTVTALDAAYKDPLTTIPLGKFGGLPFGLNANAKAPHGGITAQYSIPKHIASIQDFAGDGIAFVLQGLSDKIKNPSSYSYTVVADQDPAGGKDVCGKNTTSPFPINNWLDQDRTYAKWPSWHCADNAKVLDVSCWWLDNENRIDNGSPYKGNCDSWK